MSSKAMAIATAGLLLISSACMVGPKYQRPSAVSVQTYKEAPPAGWKDALPNDGAIRGKWWLVYNDPRLNELEEMVSLSNQNVLVAEAQFREAKAVVRIARSGLFPTLSAAPSGTRSRSGGVYTIPIDLGYQVDIWGSIRRGVAADSSLAQASAAQLGNALLLYQTELATDYFEVQGLDASRHLLDATVKSYEKYVELTQNRYEGGVASMGDVALAQTQLETARAQLTGLGVQRAQFEHAIAVLAGKPPSDLPLAHTPDQAQPPVIPVGVPSTLLERRPDVAAAERQVSAANEQIGIAKAALYPTVSITAAAGSQSVAILDLLTWPSRFWSVGPQLAQTLFDAGKRRAQVKLTQAAYDATVASYRQTVLTGFQQVEDSLAQLRILSEEGVIVDRAVTASQRSLEISTDQYRGGLTNYLQVITSQTLALQNQRSAVDLLTQRMVASVSLIYALGGGWDSSQIPSTRDLLR